MKTMPLPTKPLPTELLRNIASLCKHAHPLEVCGLWWWSFSGYHIHSFEPNEANATPTSFSLSPLSLLPILQQLDQEEGSSLQGWFHSHPHHPPFPSQDDLAAWLALPHLAWWPSTKLLLLSPTQDAYAWALYASPNDSPIARGLTTYHTDVSHGTNQSAS